MGDVITNILQSHPFTEGFWPEHVARLERDGAAKCDFQAGGD